jgi:hypothetical protein
VLFERERFRLRLRALDVLCGASRAGRLQESSRGQPRRLAVELRERTRTRRIHLTEGNAVEALRQYRLCRRLLAEQLGIDPSA